MRARIWGCRGSLAAPGPETVRYGGNTSCVEVRLDDGTAIVLDAGTGIRPLGLQLDREQVKVVHLLLSHLHMDHLQGLGFFRPIYDAGVELHVWGPPSTVQSLEDRIGAYLSPPLFPVSLSEIPSKLFFHDAPDEPWQIGSASVLAVTVAHQGPTLGYRIEEGGRSLAYIPDHEPSIGVDLRSLGEDWLSGHAVAREADVLIHDAQYSEEEYPLHVGWGHSSIEHVVTFAQLAKVKRLLLFHHDPHHSDEELDALCVRAQELWPDCGDRLAVGAEGMEIVLSALPSEPSLIDR
ncbi:MAG: MBL fold metallo-hydrolase [Actinobacteria bacterium]|nr:MBL fold metallo-hydrolase [Actinomycetota bacterium]